LPEDHIQIFVDLSAGTDPFNKLLLIGLVDRSIAFSDFSIINQGKFGQRRNRNSSTFGWLTMRQHQVPTPIGAVGR
jgi:hypothetical protein